MLGPAGLGRAAGGRVGGRGTAGHRHPLHRVRALGRAAGAEAGQAGPRLRQARCTGQSGPATQLQSTLQMVVVAGGYGEEGLLTSTEILRGPVWEEVASLPYSAHGLVLVNLAGSLFLAAGQDSNNNYRASQSHSL